MTSLATGLAGWPTPPKDACSAHLPTPRKLLEAGGVPELVRPASAVSTALVHPSTSMALLPAPDDRHAPNVGQIERSHSCREPHGTNECVGDRSEDRRV